MNLLFPFASLGVINGILVVIYLVFKKDRVAGDFYFAGLLLSFCLRIGKSVLLFYGDPVDPLFLQIGLSACIFIGPFFFLYLKSVANNAKDFKNGDIILLVLTLFFIVGIGLLFPYRTFPDYWNPEIVQVIYAVWGVFALLGLRKAYTILGGGILMPWTLKEGNRYLASIVLVVMLITLTYQLALYLVSFTYIWGAFIFSGSFYILGFRAIKSKPVTGKPIALPATEAEAILKQLGQLMDEEKPYRNQNLKMDDLAKRMKLSRHLLSQVLNETSANGYSNFIKGYRVAEAKRLIGTHSHMSLEGIGYEAGFKSKSSFYDAFKQVESCTPSQFKKHLELKRS